MKEPPRISPRGALGWLCEERDKEADICHNQSEGFVDVPLSEGTSSYEPKPSQH